MIPFWSVSSCGMCMYFNRFLKVVPVIVKDKAITSKLRAHSCVNLFASLDHLAYLKVYRKQYVQEAALLVDRRKLTTVHR